MMASGPSDSEAKSTTILILGREYRVRCDADETHLNPVAAHVDSVLRDLQRTTPDTQDAAILAALNIASDLLRIRDHGTGGTGGTGVSDARIQALIDLVDSV